MPRRSTRAPDVRRPRWLPARTGAVVALLGPDGAGKGTVIEGVLTSGLDATVVYLGRPARRAAQRPTSRLASQPAGRKVIGELAVLTHRALEHLWLLARAYRAAWRGHLVLCDRHPIEVLALTPRRTAPARRFEEFIAERVMPWPDAVILLDAPGSRLHDRKGEHSPERLEAWRQAYLRVFEPRGAIVVSTDGPVQESTRGAICAVRAAADMRRRSL